ncbi:MAG: tetratricopeptide repeat protein [Acidobacteriota bacterium]
MLGSRIAILSLIMALFPAFLGAATWHAEKPSFFVNHFENRSSERGYYWIGEAIADLISLVIETNGEDVIARKDRLDVYNTFGFSPISSPTLATQIRMAEHLQATHLIYGSFDSVEGSLTVQITILDIQKASLLKKFSVSATVREILSLKKEICKNLFLNGQSMDCSTLFRGSEEDAVPLPAYEAFIKATIEDSFARKEELYGKAIALFPDFSRAAYELGLLYFNNSQFKEAEKILWKLQERKFPTAADACLILGEIFLDRGRNSDATEVLKKAVSYGGTGKAHFLLAKAYYMSGDLENARRELEISIKLDPTDIDARSLKKTLDQKKE